MLTNNSNAVMDLLKSTDVVLDIGGWAHPFNRANYVMDQEPYESRGYYNRTFAKNNPFPPLGGTVERFTKDTWIQRDICDKTPFPFRDKELDYVICSHTLEDIRDPLWVCSEMIRVAKRGYIEVPSRPWESSRGSEPRMAGLSHHRWLIDIDPNAIRFMMKFHSIHSWRNSLPPAFLRTLTEQEKVQWIFWDESFKFSEITLHGDLQVAELRRFVDSVRPHSPLLLRWDGALDRLASLAKRATGYAARHLTARSV